MGFADITIYKTSEAMKVSAKDAGSHETKHMWQSQIQVYYSFELYAEGE